MPLSSCSRSHSGGSCSLPTPPVLSPDGLTPFDSSKSLSGRSSSGGAGIPRITKEGDWDCPTCKNINFAKRTRCNVCQAPKPKIDPPPADLSQYPPGLFKRGDWPCTHCGNVNWARRDKCNMCNAPKPSGGEQPRLGRGGGHFDLQESGERNQHDSDREDYDEFGRRKKKRRRHSLSNAGSSERYSSPPQQHHHYHQSTQMPSASPPLAASRFPTAPPNALTSAYYDSSSTNADQPTADERRMAFPPAPLAHASVSAPRAAYPSAPRDLTNSSTAAGSAVQRRSTETSTKDDNQEQQSLSSAYLSNRNSSISSSSISSNYSDDSNDMSVTHDSAAEDDHGSLPLPNENAPQQSSCGGNHADEITQSDNIATAIR